MHSINITLPWTIGVFMVRNFMGIGHGDMPMISPSSNQEMPWSAAAPSSWSEAALAPSPDVYVEKAARPDLDGEPSANVQRGSAPSAEEQKVRLEAHVGYQAGILSSAFSISQVMRLLPEWYSVRV